MCPPIGKEESVDKMDWTQKLSELPLHLLRRVQRGIRFLQLRTYRGTFQSIAALKRKYHGLPCCPELTPLYVSSGYLPMPIPAFC